LRAEKIHCPVKKRARAENSLIILVTVAILLVHAGLLLVSIPDYRVTIDSAYHVSMGRYYGEHGLAEWDHINFGPRGRPNLQGPLLHAAIGGLGRLLGGRGDNYVLANALLGLMQWAAAMGTAAFFALWLSGEIGMLLAVALLSGAAFASTSFAVGIPSGWLFIFTPWAIWFFLEKRMMAAAIAAALAIYSHIGGYLTAPAGIAIAALITGRWRHLLRCGVLTAILTLPYTIHVIRYLGWFSGVKSHSALLLDPMLDALAIAGAIGLLCNPREYPFMTAWLLAPIAWLFQDSGRFLLQWQLAGSVAAGWFLVSKLERFEMPRRIRYALGTTVLATFLPFGLPSLAGEAAWTAGNHYPREVDWRAARDTAAAIKLAGLTNKLLSGYSPPLCPAIAVYADISCEKGDWVEVQPRTDPADYLPAEQKTYVVPLASNDPMLTSLRSRGWITVYRQSAASALPAASTLLRLKHPPSIDAGAQLASSTIATEAAWLGRNAINNELSLHDFPGLLSASAREQFRRWLLLQREHAGRIELACLLYAWTLEADDAADAQTMRQIALKMGVIASYLSDDFALDFLSQRRLADLRERFLELATRSNRLAFDPSPSPELMANFASLFSTALNSHGEMFTGRPAGDWLPWLSG
jgi:hypothetical protein